MGYSPFSFVCWDVSLACFISFLVYLLLVGSLVEMQAATSISFSFLPLLSMKYTISFSYLLFLCIFLPRGEQMKQGSVSLRVLYRLLHRLCENVGNFLIGSSIFAKVIFCI